MARQRVPNHVKAAVDSSLARAGIVLVNEAPERRDLELAFLRDRVEALKIVDARNKGEVVANPPSPNQTGAGPTLQKAFDSWKNGVGARGEKVPAPDTVEEATYAVRRLRSSSDSCE